MVAIDLSYQSTMPNNTLNSPLKVSIQKAQTDNINIYEINLRNDSEKE